MRRSLIFLIVSFSLVSFSAGASLVWGTRERVTRVVCERGNEIALTEADETDPYIRWRSACNVNDANGRVVTVEWID